MVKFVEWDWVRVIFIFHFVLCPVWLLFLTCYFSVFHKSYLAREMFSYLLSAF